MRYLSKKTKRLIVASLLTGSLILAPEMCEFPFSSVAFTEVKMYMGTAEDYASPIESQEVAKLRAREKAIQRAKEQAGVILQNYSRSINAVLTDDEISTITANTYQMVGEPVYEQAVQKISDTSTVILWKATVSVNIDDDEVKAWLKRNKTEKNDLIQRNNELKKAVDTNNQEVESLRKRAEGTISEQEQRVIKAEFEKLDNEFLYNQKMQEANRMRYKNQYNNAVNAYSEAIRLDPDHAEAYKSRGDVYAVLGNIYHSSTEHQKALADYNKAIELNPNYVEAYSMRGYFYSNSLKDNARAMDDVKKAIQIDPNNSFAYLTRAAIYGYSIKDLDAALADYNKAIQVDPKNSKAYIARGGFLGVTMKKVELGLADYDKAIELDPNDSDAYMSRGIFYEYELKDNRKALADLDKAIELNPENGHNYILRAFLHEKMGNKQLADADRAKAEELKKRDAEADSQELKVKMMVSEARKCSLTGQKEKAITIYSDAIQLDPSFADAYVGRGEVYKDMREFGQAIADFTKVIQIDPSFADAYVWRGKVYHDMREFGQAIADFTQAIQIDPNNAKAYTGRGKSYDWMKQKDKALENFNRAVAVYTEAIRLQSKDASLYNARASVYHYDLKDYRKAIDDYTMVLKLEPGWTFIYTSRGNCYKALGDMSKAEADYKKAKK